MNLESVIHKEGYFGTDAAFDRLYPYHVQKLARSHWTPLNISRLALGFLAINECRVLDIGSGVGKFCLTGAYYAPGVHFTGVEQRRNLVQHATYARRKLNLPNASFINANFTQFDFRQYDHFYFYNAFYENLIDADRIDDTIEYSTSLYSYYVRYLFKELRSMPTGTRIVTYHAGEDEIPDCYHLIESHAGDFLKFWIKL